MVYIDHNLCTGCGSCVDACAQGAISLDDSAALIDQSLCTSCGRCVDLCLTGAIISIENGAGRLSKDLPAPLETPLLTGVKVQAPSVLGGACRAVQGAGHCGNGRGRSRGRSFGGGPGRGGGRRHPKGHRAGR